jgi:predicted ATPase
MLETVREYAAERLATSGEAAHLRRQHCLYLRSLAEKVAPEQSGQVNDTWLVRLAREHADVRAALQWAQDSGEIALGLHLAATLAGFWVWRDHAKEGCVWLESLLAQAGSDHTAIDPRLRVKALQSTIWLATELGDYRRANDHAEEGLLLTRRLSDR